MSPGSQYFRVQFFTWGIKKWLWLLFNFYIIIIVHVLSLCFYVALLKIDPFLSGRIWIKWNAPYQSIDANLNIGHNWQVQTSVPWITQLTRDSWILLHHWLMYIQQLYPGNFLIIPKLMSMILIYKWLI